MGRPKGSKNKNGGQKQAKETLDYKIAQQQDALRVQTERVEQMTGQMITLKKELSAAKIACRKSALQLERLYAKRAEAARADTELKLSAEASRLVATLLAEGKSTEDILGLLKTGQPG